MEQPKQQRRYEAAQRRIAKQKEVFIEALMKTGNIEAACHAVHISRMTYTRWIKEDRPFLDAAQSARNIGIASTCDVIEGKLVSKASNGDMQAIKFYLSNKHKEYRRRVSEDAEHNEGGLTPEESAKIDYLLKNINEALSDDEDDDPSSPFAQKNAAISNGDYGDI